MTQKERNEVIQRLVETIPEWSRSVLLDYAKEAFRKELETIPEWSRSVLLDYAKEAFREELIEENDDELLARAEEWGIEP